MVARPSRQDDRFRNRLVPKRVETMAAALIDRLLHHCHIVNVRGNSYRMRTHQDLLRPAHESVARKPARDQPPTTRPRRASGVGLRSLRSLRPTPEPWTATPDACSGPSRPRRSVQFSVATTVQFSVAIDSVGGALRSEPQQDAFPARSPPCVRPRFRPFNQSTGPQG